MKAAAKTDARGRSRKRIDEILSRADTLDLLAVEAAAAEDYGAAVRARVESSKLRAEVAQLREADAITHTADELAKIRAQRRQALAAGSHVAAEKLARQERELLALRAAERQAAEESRRAATDDEAVVSAIGEEVGSLPAAALDRLASLVEAERSRRRSPAVWAVADGAGSDED